jgi:HK97 family phage prohead protease
MKDKKTLIRRQMFTPTQLQVREAAEGETPSRTITGYAVLFDTPSAPMWQDEDGEAREVIAKGAITRDLLDGCDIKMTMFHNRQLLLARSKEGEGTLAYEVDDTGVKFSFDAPNTADGDKALELVRRGDLGGCSFAFTTRYYDDACVERVSKVVNTRTEITYRVKAVTGVYDFTITDNPAYPDTSVEAREFVEGLKEPEAPEAPQVDEKKLQEQLREMRCAAQRTIFE